MSTILIAVLIAVSVITGGILGLYFLASGTMKGWRTIWFNSIVAFVGGLLPLASDLTDYVKQLDWTQYASPHTAAIIIAVIGAVGILLRFATHGPVGQGQQ
jgi:hypothetical protein